MTYLSIIRGMIGASTGGLSLESIERESCLTRYDVNMPNSGTRPDGAGPIFETTGGSMSDEFDDAVDPIAAAGSSGCSGTAPADEPLAGDSVNDGAGG